MEINANRQIEVLNLNLLDEREGYLLFEQFEKEKNL